LKLNHVLSHTINGMCVITFLSLKYQSRRDHFKYN